ncbi:MAG: hypothetical protein N4A72_01485 [Bacteroidales bacterium]|jgi:cobalamin synthase|nr:hypothetical protein [Bacteroidales bacterium]
MKDNTINQESKNEETNTDWSDYSIPEKLPAPIPIRKPTITIPIIGGLLTATILAFIYAKLVFNNLYIIGLYEIVIAFVFGFVMRRMVRKGNYIIFRGIKIIIICSVISTFLLSHLFQYFFAISSDTIDSIGFLNYMYEKISFGLVIKDFNIGTIGLIVSWIVQIILIYFLSALRTYKAIIGHTASRVPGEVIVFTMYLLNKGKSDEEIKDELAKYGWTDEYQVNYVFEAVIFVQGFALLDKEGKL